MRGLRLLVASILAVVLLSPSVGAATDTLIATGAAWKYLDNGTDQGTAWRGIAFNDSDWASGPAQLGYGDGDEATVVGYGGNTSARYITTYFRRTFTVADPSIYAGLTLRLLRDDGAVVYLNGVEIYRNNMPAGTVTYTTVASSALGGVDETTFVQSSVAASGLAPGTNVLAVELHQSGPTSSDISFDFELTASTNPSVVRGPYLQMATPSSLIVRWRTDVATDSAVRYGTTAGDLSLLASDGTLTTEHQVTLTGLSANTKYFYSVGSSTAAIASGADQYFTTPPAADASKPTRIWVLGDPGTGTASQTAVRDAYNAYTGSRGTDVWLMLGDNAYNSGTDTEYQSNVFNIYPTTFKQVALWSTIGNHDTAQSTNPSPTIPYYQIFNLPTAGEAGGSASLTEDYYSFDYGNIHFVCLDSMTSDRSTTGAMANWLRDDLSSTTKQWVIAFWHHPPYTKGSHDSDTETQLIEMRTNLLPILEDYGVDLVLTGHSHAYERSYLIDSHYGPSTTWNAATMAKDAGSGREDGTGAYVKATNGMAAHEGAVFAVAGSSGQISGGSLNHPAMYISLNSLGSMVVDVDGNRLDAKFLRETGAVDDYFSIVKPLPLPTLSINDVTVTEGNTGTANASFTVSLSTASAQTVTVSAVTSNGTATSGSDYSATGPTTVTFAPGDTAKTFAVPVLGDAIDEANETFNVTLSGPSNATISDATGLGTITDDDDPPPSGPTISAFTASNVLVNSGGAATLSWSASGATTLTLNGSPVANPTGSQLVNPTITTTYTLLASNGSGSASRQATIAVNDGVAALGTPTITAPTAGQTVVVTGVGFSWNTVANAAGYDLRVYDGSTGATLFSGSLLGGASTTALVTLSAGSYRFGVRACSGGFDAAHCGSFATRDFSVAPAAPGGVPTITFPTQGATLSTSTQTLQWTAVTPNPALSGLSYEVLLRNISAGTTTLQIAVPAPATSTIFTMGSSTQYELKVRACQAGCGPWSTPVTFSVALPPVPTTVPMIGACSLSPDAWGASMLHCVWSAIANADTYQVQVVQPPPAGPGGGALTVAARAVSEAGTHFVVPPGDASVYVQACNGDGCGPSATRSITASGLNPSVPALGTPMTGTVVNGPTVLFTWNRVPDDSGSNTTYRLYVQDLSRQSAALDVYTTQNFHAAYFKAEGARYDGLVIANPGLPSQVTGPASGFNVSGLSAAAPTMVSPAHNSTVSSGNVQLGWSPVPGATLYEYFVAIQGQGDATVRGVTQGLLAQVPLAGTGGGTVYSGIVRACPAGATCQAGVDANWGPWSNLGGPGVTNFTVIP